MTQSVGTTLSRAERLARKGEAPSAAFLYMSVLIDKPANRRAQDGLAKLRNLHRAPTKEQMQGLQALYAAGDNGALFAACQPLLALHPDCAPLSLLAGAAQANLGEHEDAIQWFSRALALQPENDDAAFNLGGVFRALERHDEALAAFERAHQLAPGRSDVLAQMAMTHMDLNECENAAIRYREAAALDPDNALYLLGIGEAETMAGRFEAAAEAFDAAHRLAPDDENTFKIRINANYQMENMAEAERAALACLARHPTERYALNKLGLIRNALGDKKGAIEAFETACRSHPEDAQTYLNYCNSARFEPGSPVIDAMRRLSDRDDLSDDDRCVLSFALFKALDGIGETDEAFGFLETGNRLRRAVVNFDMETERAVVARVKEVFGQEVPCLADSRPGDPTPIFVLGLPRSGSTLVEQIISSHGKVTAAGELFTFAHSVNRSRLLESAITEATLEKIRTWYLRGVSRRTSGAGIFTDKMPSNFIVIGAIIAALPQARIVHLKRDPRPVCWSAYQRYFTNRSPGISFTYDQIELADYVAMHDDLMAFWHRRFPGRIVEVDYQALVEDQEAQTRRLIDAVGLDWDPACLDFHKSGRAVRTASAGQVHRPIYKGSNEAWRRYEDHLSPLLTRLAERGCLADHV